MLKIKYIPLIDLICRFIVLRSDRFDARHMKRKASVHKTVSLGVGVYLDKNVEIKENSYINSYSQVTSGENSKVTIGKNCAIGHNVHIKARTHDTQNATPKNGKNHITIEKDIIIGDNVWIGDNVFIKEGIIIGNNSIIGANAVVTKNIDSNSIYAGIPAKKIGELTP